MPRLCQSLTIFHFRFYSCTDYFSLPPQLTGDWHDLSLASWEQLEDRLRERLDSVASAVTRIEPGTLLRVSETTDYVTPLLFRHTVSVR